MDSLDASLSLLVVAARQRAMDDAVALLDWIGERDPNEIEAEMLTRLDRIVLGADLLLGAPEAERRLKF